jgi:hypothetical protein
MAEPTRNRPFPHVIALAMPERPAERQRPGQPPRSIEGSYHGFSMRVVKPICSRPSATSIACTAIK